MFPERNKLFRLSVIKPVRNKKIKIDHACANKTTATTYRTYSIYLLVLSEKDFDANLM